MEKELNRPSLLRPMEDKFSATYSLDDYLDPKELEREKDKIIKEQNNAINTLRMYAKLPDAKSARAFQQVDSKPRQIMDTPRILIEKVESHSEVITLSEVNFSHVLLTAGQSLANNSIERQSRLAEKFDISYFNEPVVQLNQFILAGEQSIKIADMSMKDFVSRSNLSPSSVVTTQVQY